MIYRLKRKNDHNGGTRAGVRSARVDKKKTGMNHNKCFFVLSVKNLPLGTRSTIIGLDNSNHCNATGDTRIIALESTIGSNCFRLHITIIVCTSDCAGQCFADGL